MVIFMADSFVRKWGAPRERTTQSPTRDLPAVTARPEIFSACFQAVPRQSLQLAKAIFDVRQDALRVGLSLSIECIDVVYELVAEFQEPLAS